MMRKKVTKKAELHQVRFGKIYLMTGCAQIVEQLKSCFGRCGKDFLWVE